MSRIRFAAALLAALALPPALSAQEIFWDGFDQGDICAWSNLPAVIQEQELANETGENDTDADAELIPRCVIVEGQIGDPVGEDADTDYYELDVEGPVLLRITVERLGGGSLVEPVYYLENNSQFVFFGDSPPAEPVLDPVSTTRQIFLPENGFAYLDPENKSIPQNAKWFINIDDTRNYFGEPCPCGGATNRYRLTVQVEPVVGPSLQFPMDQEDVAMDATGAVTIFRIDGSQIASLTNVETFSDRLGSGLLDTKLYLVRKIGNSLDTIVGSDDFDPDAFHFDSKFTNQALLAGPYFVILDAYAKYEIGPIDVPLTIDFPALP